MTTFARRFTYGDQFDSARFNLPDLIELCVQFQSERYVLQENIRQLFFEQAGRNSDNSKKMAMNCVLSLNAYRLIHLSDNGKIYTVTDLALNLLKYRESPRELHRQFARHIITELDGLTLARLIENIRARGEQVTLEYLGEEMTDLGIKVPPNSTYISTMRDWLAQAGVFRESGYEVNWDVIYDILEVDSDTIDNLYSFDPEQRYFLRSLANLNATEFTPSNRVAEHTRSVYKVRLTTKNLVKDVLEPLQTAGFIDIQKTTVGRGAKPHLVRLSSKAKVEILEPLISNLSNITELTTAELNRSFESVVQDLDSTDKHVRGKALELLAVWIIRLLGLRFSKWRVRDFKETGQGEVDVMAASDRIVYSRWQIQCKNIQANSKVSVDVVAKEVGLTFLTRADIVMLVTTGTFSADAVTYANQVTDNSRYYVILLERDDVMRIVKDRTRIVDILNYKARRTFAKRELGLSDLGDELIGEEIMEEADDIAEDISSDEES